MKDTFQNAVIARISGDKNHGWGIDDSMAVIEACFLKSTGKGMEAELKMAIHEVVNPSQFRQKLEGQLLNKPMPKAEKIRSTFAKFNV